MNKRRVDLLAAKIDQNLAIDGDLSKPEWVGAHWSKRFRDMASGGAATYDTRAAILWSDEFLYISFQAEEPFLQAQLTERDSIIFLENDLEVFIDGGDCYYELEVNAANTIYEVFFIWKDAFARFVDKGFSILDDGAYTFGGDYDRTGATFWKGTHPRGIRFAFTHFDMPGLQTATHLAGTLNDDSDIDEGWSLEIAIPWKSLELLGGTRSVPPMSGDIWQIFLGRFQRQEVAGREVLPHPASSLTAHGVYDTHLPEKWSQVEFLD